MEYFPRIAEEREISRLLWLSRQQYGRMVLVYGRPGSGRTSTIRRVLDGSRSVTFHVGGKTAGLQMQEFLREARSVLGPEGDWNAATPSNLLERIASRSVEETTAVVFENFEMLSQYWKDEYTAIDAFWKQMSRKTRMFLILCGSSVPALERIFTTPSSPMYNVLDSKVLIPSLKSQDLKLLLNRSGKEASSSAVLLAWAMTGGLSSLVSPLVDSGAWDIPSMLETYFSPDSPFVCGPDAFLSGLFGRDRDVYMSVLQAIACGNSSQKEIESYLGMNVGGHLFKLETVYDLVCKERPAFARPDSRGAVRYSIKDVDIEFWFRFVYARRSLVAAGDFRKLRECASDGLEEWLDHVQVRYFRQKLSEESDWQHVEGWWNPVATMDVVAWSDNKKRIYVAKSYRDPVGFDPEKFRADVNAFKIITGKAGGLQASYLTRKDV